ncbi:hypothetical protein B4147_3232 [Bacillus wiedmannii]|uniref:Uncharacterized protein n=1 Tax=Bacillus wiedmannii TaxID=1890302 RepID=A0A0G8C6H0_9BACI|nr:hypothetical protein B4147_3232 [Bacillus wiedmannii]
MFSLLLIPATFITVAYFYQSNGSNDKKKIATFFEITKVCVQHKGELQYLIFIKEIKDDISMNYVYSPSRTRKPLVFRHGMKVRLDKECY